MADKTRILVVDDSRTTRQQLDTFLSSKGFDVSQASSGLDGLAVAGGGSFNLCIVDVNMPGMNGLDMIRELRTLDGYATTPVFVLTTESTRELIARGKEVGATAWIVKPFQQESLLMGIEKALAMSASA